MSVLYKTINRISNETGYSEHAIRTKIRDGVWPEGDVWIKAPDGRILINVEGYNKWVKSELELPLGRNPALKSHSTIKVKNVEKQSVSSPLPLT